MTIKKAQIHTYLRQYDNKLLTAYCYINGNSKSEVLQKAIKQIFAGMSDFDKNQLLDVYEGMSEERRKSPKLF